MRKYKIHIKWRNLFVILVMLGLPLIFAEQVNAKDEESKYGTDVGVGFYGTYETEEAQIPEVEAVMPPKSSEEPHVNKEILKLPQTNENESQSAMILGYLMLILVVMSKRSGIDENL